MIIGSLDHQNRKYQVVFNPQTQIASIKPLPSLSELNNYYQNLYSSSKTPDPSLKKYLQRFRALKKYCSSGHLLDIGAGQGHFISQVKKDPNWQAEGLEISSNACKQAKVKYSLGLHQGTLESVKFPLKSFDVITLYAVLEHLPDLDKALNKIYLLLKPNGLIVVRVPNIFSFEFFFSKLLFRPYPGFIFEHLHYFTPKGLKQLLTLHQFHLLSISSRHYADPGPIRKHPYWLITNLAKRFLEHTFIGGKLCFGNTLMAYAVKKS